MNKTPRRPRLSTQMISQPYLSSTSSLFKGRSSSTTSSPQGRARAFSTNLDFSPLSLDASPIYQNVIPFNVAEEIARFEKDFVQPLTDRGTEEGEEEEEGIYEEVKGEEEEEGIYEEVKVEEEEKRTIACCSSSSSSLSSDSGAFSRLSTPDLSVKSAEREKCSSSSSELSTSSSSSSSSSTS